jgi:hypothetical protein
LDDMTNRFVRNVIVKGLLLFFLVDLVFPVVDLSKLGKISFYNSLFTGRQRFPFGEDSSQSYNLSLFNLDAMFASHVIAGQPKTRDEYRVIVIGDSSVWGILLHPEETLSGQLNQMDQQICSRTIQVYNLGYPTISLTKDLMILNDALSYQPDLVIWMVTLEAFPVDVQLTSPIITNNASRVKELISQYDLELDPNDPSLIRPAYWNLTLVGERRSLADLIRLQLYGVLWTATRIDQAYPVSYQPAETDLNTNIAFHDLQPPTLNESQLSFGVLEAGLQALGNIPVLLVNEPMLISNGENSNLKYNFFYPRWAYDQWREMMSSRAVALGWNYLDLWNLVPSGEFTNSAIHLTNLGESILAARIEQTILQQSCP